MFPCSVCNCQALLNCVHTVESAPCPVVSSLHPGIGSVSPAEYLLQPTSSSLPYFLSVQSFKETVRIGQLKKLLLSPPPFLLWEKLPFYSYNSSGTSVYHSIQYKITDRIKIQAISNQSLVSNMIQCHFQRFKPYFKFARV